MSKLETVSLSRRDRMTTASCGCVLEDGGNVTFFHYCPTHRVAPRMLAELRTALEIAPEGMLYETLWSDRVRAILREVEG